MEPILQPPSEKRFLVSVERRLLLKLRVLKLWRAECVVVWDHNYDCAGGLLTLYRNTTLPHGLCRSGV